MGSQGVAVHGLFAAHSYRPSSRTRTPPRTPSSNLGRLRWRLGASEGAKLRSRRAPRVSAAQRAGLLRCQASRSPAPHPEAPVVDVAVVGGGIVGLCIARSLLKAGLEVALVERRMPCAGATGAGQGYVWLAHREPSSLAWPLATWSKQLWEDLVGSSPHTKLETEWEQHGSLLVGSTPEEAAQLRDRKVLLGEMDVQAAFLNREQVQMAEPALSLPAPGAGLEVPTDAQINGRLSAFHLLDMCKTLGREKARLNGEEAFKCLLDTDAEGLHLEGRRAAGVNTAAGRVEVRKGVVLAAGAWTGKWLADALGDERWKETIVPRRGHLLELDAPPGMPPLTRGVMEVSYSKHYSQPGGSGNSPSAASAEGKQQLAAGGEADESDVDITFTVTKSASGKLLIGSSREYSGWDTEASPTIIRRILERAAVFLPHLSKDPAAHPSLNTRVGLRPLATRGLPFIGPVENMDGLFVAAGHEGSGLTLGLATAELIRWHITGDSANNTEQPTKVPAALQSTALYPSPSPEAHQG